MVQVGEFRNILIPLCEPSPEGNRELRSPTFLTDLVAGSLL